MRRERIRDEDDAKRLAHENPLVKPHRNNHKVHAGPRADHGVTGVGMDGFEIDPAALDQALHKLRGLQAQLQEHLDNAQDLARHLPDGGGPVAMVMRRTFHIRAHADRGGVQAVLRDYIHEVDGIIDVLQLTRASYADLDADAGAGLSAAATTQPGEVS